MANPNSNKDVPHEPSIGFNQEKALVGAFSVITNLRMELFEALIPWSLGPGHTPTAAPPPAHTPRRTTFLLILYSNYSTTTYAQHSGITGTIFSVNVNSLDLLLWFCQRKTIEVFQIKESQLTVCTSKAVIYRLILAKCC